MNRGKNFYNNQSGATALIFGLVFAFVLVAILSLTVDLGRTQTSYSKNQGATDAAAAAGAELWLKAITNNIGVDPNPFNVPAPDSLTQYATDTLKNNFASDQASAFLDMASVKVSSNRTGPDAGGNYLYTVNVNACANLGAPIAAAAGHTQSNADCGGTDSAAGACTRTCTNSTAQFGLTVAQNLEVAFALDFTNSMFWQGDPWPNCNYAPDHNSSNSLCPPYSQTKAYYLNDAMNQTLDNDAYFPKQNSTVWASIVPYSSIVNLYPYNKTIINDSESLNPVTDAKGTNGYYTNPTFYDLTLQGLDPNGPSYQYFTGTTYYTDFGMAEDYPNDPTKKAYFQYYDNVLDRIPTIDPGSFSSLLSDSSDGGSTQFKSYRAVYNYLTTAPDVTHAKARNSCYNSALNAAFDQRIEKDVIQTTGDSTHQPDGLVALDDMTEPAYGSCTKLSCYNADSTSPTKSYTKYESFPVQPLTNNTAILKDVVNRFVATTPLFANSTSVDPNLVVDRQSSPLTKSSNWSKNLVTSSIHGLLWAWFTVNNNWQGRWDAASVHENYYTNDNGAQSQQSRAGLPSSKHTKHIIFMTDGNDNDGGDANCDAYAPTGKFSTADYTKMCTKIKSEGIIIHVLLLDFQTTPDTEARFDPTKGGCASPGEYHANVKPNEIQGYLNQIFRSIITGATTVRLSK